MTSEPTKPKKPRKPRELTPRQKNMDFLIRKFIPEEKIKLFGQKDWTINLHAAKQLLDKCEDMEFWGSMNLGFSLNCLLFLVSPKGQDLLRQEWKKYKYVPISRPPSVIISPHKHGEDVSIPTKPKTLKEFLQNG